MTHFLSKEESLSNDSIKLIEQEIALLEKELLGVEAEVTTFEFQIRSTLHVQILRLRELAILYKSQKAAKKAKRIEQKKKGKNYKEPPKEKIAKVKQKESDKLSINKEQELKRLYKEAVVQVHPDKFANENDQISERANEVTVQLNSIYQSGDLEELKGFYEHIISGNAMSHVPYQSESIADPKALLVFLKKKKKQLMDMLEETKSSETYVVLKTYENPYSFIDELKEQFEQRIRQLEKRTRINK